MKEGGWGRDVLIAALIVSATVHLGLMYWAQPKVMTRVAAGVRRAARHQQMKVSDAPEAPEQVRIDVLEDLPAQKAAPTADETRAAVPAAETAAPEKSVDAVAVPPAADIAEIISRNRPDVSAPVFESAQVAEIKAPKEAPKVGFETPAVGEVSAPAPSVPVKAEVSAPQFEAAVFGPVALVAPDGGRAEIAKLDADAESEEEKEKEEFKPVEEVMHEVDEKVVEREKAAVRDLIDVTKAADFSSVANVAVEKFAVDGWTYFKARVTPKARVPVVPKDMVVIIDASGSIGKERLTSCRNAAKRVLRTAMNSGDRFNLVAFRNRFEYAFKTWRDCDAKGFGDGDAWLDRLAAHGRTDVFATISSVLTLPRDPARPLVALVITDGDANEGVNETAEILSKFTRLNDGLVSVHMYGVRKSGNRELIDVLTRGNRGESMIFDGWAKWKAGEDIGAFTERFRDPVLSDLRIVFSATSAAEAYPAYLKNLCQGSSVDIIGRVKAGAKDVAFSLKGLAGATAYEGFFRLPLEGARVNPALFVEWTREKTIDGKLK